MGWFRRWKRRMRNLASGGDYAGSQGARADGERSSRNAGAQFEATFHRPDRLGHGPGSG